MALPLALASALVLLTLLFVRGESGLYGEDGPVEVATIVAYLCAALLYAWLVPGLAFGREWQIPVTLILAILREMDLDKSLLSGGILKSRFYTGDYPLWEKAIGLAIVIFALWTGVRLVRRGLPAMVRGVRDGQVWPWLVALSVALVVIAKGVFDGLGRKLLPFGVEVPQDVVDSFARAEEWMELGTAIFAMVAIPLWYVSRRR
ncbi:hypothetical protein [Jannaschia seosinensis]|uniref:hypothetical protein n=1 Tax=Jannaschia seosinensis TaxID=313367 RepID=UPI001C9268BD|nr:hypothetical protein [Jannaschia seosinensis]